MAGLTDITVANFTEIHYTKSTAYDTELTNIQSITHPTDERTIVEVQQYGQIYPRKLTGGSTTGNLEVVVNFDPDDGSHADMLAFYKDGLAHDFQVRVLEGEGSAVYTYYNVSGRVASKSAGGEYDDVLTLTFSIAIDDAIGDWTPAAAP